MSRTSEALPTLTGNGMRFEVRHGTRRIGCAVLDEALEAAAGLIPPSTVSLRRGSFDRFRTLIDAAAKLKLRKLPPEFVGPIVLHSDDLRCVPPTTGTPLFGSSARGPAHRVAAVELRSFPLDAEDGGA